MLDNLYTVRRTDRDKSERTDIMKNNIVRKICAGTAALTLCTSAVIPASAAEVLTGDADANGVIQSLDLVALKAHLLDTEALSEAGRANADMNGDKEINALDYILLKSFLVNGNGKPAEPGTPSETDSVRITLAGTSVTADEGVTVEGTKVTISKSGSYTVTGAMTADASIIVNTAETDAESVEITLDGVTMKNSTDTPCIMVENADKTKITLTGENSLSNTFDAAEANSAVIYAKDDITFTKSSSGSLQLETNAQTGIYCNNDIKFNGGKIEIKTDAADSGLCKADAVKAKGDVELAGGELYINSAGDGFKSSKQAAIISGGKAVIKSGKDAVQGETAITVTGGDIIACGDRGLAVPAGTLEISADAKIFATATEGLVVNDFKLDKNVIFAWLGDIHPKTEIISLDGKVYTPLKKYMSFLINDPSLTAEQRKNITVGGKPVTEVINTSGEGSLLPVNIGADPVSSTDKVSETESDKKASGGLIAAGSTVKTVK